MTVIGPDISKWNGDWNAEKAKQAGAVFVFIKASQATFTDPQFINNWKKAKDAGLLRGAYHYLDYTKSGEEQGDYLADLLLNDPGELPPIVDYEQTRTDNDHAAALRFLKDFVYTLYNDRSEIFENMRVKKPMIYTGANFWNIWGDQDETEYWSQFPLWTPHWTTAAAPLVPSSWTMWNFWQFTSKGPGEAFGSQSLVVDLNRFNGTLQELLEFAGVSHPLEDLGAKVAILDDRVNTLASAVAAINENPPGGGVDPELVSRVDDLGGLYGQLEDRVDTLAKAVANLNSNGSYLALHTKVSNLGDQITNLGGTISNVNSILSSRLTVVEQKVAALGTGTGPVTPLSTPVTIPTTPTPVTIPTTPAPETIPTTPAPETIPTTPAPVVTATYAVCTVPVLNVRSGPGASSPVVTTIPIGTQVKVLKRQDGWAQIESPAGWCSESYLSFGTSSTPPGTATPPPAGTYAICNTNGLNVRNGPGVTYAIIGGLVYGQRVKLLTRKNGWAQLDSPAGWCNETYLSF